MTKNVDPKHKVVIAAAVAFVAGEQARIRRIREVRGTSAGEWVRQGRAAMQGVHNVRSLATK